MGLLTACATRPAQGPMASPVSTCSVAVSSGPIRWGDSSNTAVQDFARLSDAAYSLLYIERTSGHPERDYDVRVAQQANGQWRLVQYRGRRTTTRTLPRSAFAGKLAVLAGHHMLVCPRFSSLSIMGVLWVKQGQTTTFSMALDLLDWKELTIREQQPLQPGFDLLQQLKQFQ